METLILSKEDVMRVLRGVGLHAFMDEVIDGLRAAFQAYDENVIEVRTRDGFAYSEPTPSLLEWMPAARVGDCAVVKLVGYNPHNPLRHELPTIVSSLTLYDLKTGHLQALCDGTFLTAVRTGAASALASEILADPDSRVMGLIGAGAQSITQLHAMTRLFPIERVLVYDVEPAVTASFRERAAFLGLEIIVCERERVEREAQIICTATSVATGAGPVIDGHQLRPDVHINAVGSDMPGKTELPLDLLQRSLVCPDYTPQAVLEGECQQLHNGHIGPSLIELSKNPAAFHRYRTETTVFDSTGFALEDMVAMQVLLAHAHRLGLGQSLAIEGLGFDALNPYSFVADAV